MLTCSAPHYRNFLSECEEVGLEALHVAAKEAMPEFIAKREAQKQEYQAQLDAWGMFRSS